MRSTSTSPADRKTGRPHRFLSYGAIGLSTVLLSLLVLSCGNPTAFRQAVDRVLELDFGGGALARLYSSPDTDDFTDAVDFEEVLHIVGSTITASDGENGIILRITDTGGIENRQSFNFDNGNNLDEAFTSIVINRGETEDTLIVGGWRELADTGNTVGTLVQLRPTGTGPDPIAVSGIGTFDINAADDANDYVRGVHAVGNSILAVGETIPDTGAESGINIGLYGLFTPGNATANFVRFVNRTGGGSDPERIRLLDAEYSDSDTYIVTGTASDQTTFELVLLAINPTNGQIIPGNNTITMAGVTNVSNDLGYSITKLRNPERFVIAGETRTDDFREAWFVMIVTWDSDMEQFDLVKAYRISFANSGEGVANDVAGLDSSENYWDVDDAFAVTGSRFNSLVMQPDGTVLAAAGPSEQTQLLNGNANAIVPHEESLQGFFVVGQNSPLADPPRSDDGMVLWTIPDDMSSFPETDSLADAEYTIEDVTAAVEARWTTGLVNVSTAPAGVASANGYQSNDGDSYPRTSIDDLQVFTP